MSTPRRFFVEYELNGRTEVFLEGEEFTHAKTVLRLEEGAEIVLLDGSGKEFSAIVANIEKHRLLAHITGAKVSDKEITHNLPPVHSVASSNNRRTPERDCAPPKAA